MKRTGAQAQNQRGFTIIEVIAVLVIIGIIAVFAVVQFSATTSYDLASQMEAVKAHLRLAQQRALASGSPWGINFNSTTYYLFNNTAPTTPVQLPGVDGATVSLSGKSSLTITSAPQTVTFDGYGSPGAANVIVTTNGGNITVTQNTGFIP